MNRYICTKKEPWVPGKGDIASHPDAILVKDNDDYIDIYDCPNCNKRFKVERSISFKVEVAN